jgi:hypothetical protein
VSEDLVADRDRTLEALAWLTTEKGYEEIEEREIAGQAGISMERFGELFGDKDTCAVEVTNSLLAAVIAVVSESYSADRSEWENALHGIFGILQTMAAKPAFAYFGYVVARQSAPERVREVDLSGHRMLIAMLERGWEYSELEHQPTRAALAVLGGAEALVRREVCLGRTSQLPELLPEVVYSATVPFLGQREALRLAAGGRGLLLERR